MRNCIAGAGDFAMAKNLSSRYPHTTAMELDVTNADALDRAISEHDVVVRLDYLREAMLTP